MLYISENKQKKKSKFELQKMLLKFSIICFFALFFGSQTMAIKTAEVHEKLLQDLSKDEIVKVVKVTRNLMASGSGSQLLKFLQQLQKIVYKRRLAKCVKILGSENICENNAKFYIWARNLAKGIMAGETF